MNLLQKLSAISPPSWTEDWLKKAGIYNDVPDRWAQGYHFLGAYGFVFTILVFSDSWLVGLLATVAIWIFFFFKEFWFDIRYESNENISTSWVDWKNWFLGSVVGLGLYLMYIKL